MSYVKNKIVKRSNCNSCKWYNAEINKAKQDRRKHERLYCSSKISRNEYLSVCKRYYELVENVKSNYLSSAVVNAENDSKNLFNVGLEVLGLCNVVQHDIKSITAEGLLCYFQDKVNIIRQSIVSNCHITNVDHHIHGEAANCQLHDFLVPDLDVLKNICLSCSNAYCGEIDVLPPAVIKANISTCLPYIHHFIYLAFNEGKFPISCKLGIIIPKVKMLMVMTQNCQIIDPLPICVIGPKLLRGLCVSN